MPEPASGNTPNPAPRPGPGEPGYLIPIYPPGPETGTRYPLGDDPVYIGRGDDCAVRNQEVSVSRHHAQIARGVGGAHVVLDLGSTNGTFVNNQRRQLATLADGDYLRVGNCVYRYLCGGNIEVRHREEMYRLTILDGLTQSHNRRHLVGFLDAELPHGRALSVVMFDIDNFREINNRLGHLGGDLFLRELVEVVRPWVRAEDVFARYGGDDFVLALVDTPQEAAAALAEQLRQAIADHDFHYEGRTARLTVSVGVAGTTGTPPVSTDGLLQMAADQLHQAKQGGRNRVVGAAGVGVGQGA
jgi:diguanylate cyclase (GGDEF)-like protein